jgi:glyoxylase-like metal-dependent hydrolase (beta-lactamase superfamily II)/rhodanese-related sulfurtransferase
MVDVAAFVNEGLGNSAYLVAIGDRRALVVDPPRDVEPFLMAARSRGLTISHTVETHLHADFVTGSRELAARGAVVFAPRAADMAWPVDGLHDGEEVDLGGLVLRAIATPGHTPEHLSYLLLDGARPIGLFSGGALLPGSVARTDLISSDQTEPLARALYHALHERLLVLPDELAVYPTHGAGSFCSAGADGTRTTTIGRERATNPLLAAPDEDAFVRLLETLFGTYPPYFRRLRELNRRGPRVYGVLPALAELNLADFDAEVARGAEVVDARPIGTYAAGHVPGSLSIALRPAFASWLGWLVALDRPVVFVLAPDQDRRDLVRQALAIGFERLAGELAGGIATWRAAARSLTMTPLIDAPFPEATVVDVRQVAEYQNGHVPESRSLELGQLAVAAPGELPEGAVLMCGHGERAMTAASLAERRGEPASVFEGGPREWMRSVVPPIHAGR